MLKVFAKSIAIRSRLFLALAAPALLAPTALGQCDWLPGEAVPGVDNEIHASVMWDPDGPGPRAPVLVIAGEFQTAGDTPASNIATWDGSTWAPLGGGTSFVVESLAVAADGSLIVGGQFSSAGGVTAFHVARWNGSAWSALGGGTSGPVYSLLALPNGDIIAGGKFAQAGAITVNNIARWDGSAWSALSSGVRMGTAETAVFALARLPSGDILAGGDFSQAGGVYCLRIARWDGSAWSPFGTAIHELNAGTVRSLAVLPDGSIYAGNSSVYRWTGTAWIDTTGGPGFGTVWSLTALPNGDVVAGGGFSKAGLVPANRVARWNGVVWSPMGSGVPLAPLNPLIFTLATLPDGRVFAGGRFSTADGLGVSNAVMWDGSSWSPLIQGTNGWISSVLRHPSGDLYAAGDFTSIGGVAANRIARWDGAAWHPLGTGMLEPVRDLAVMPNGDVVASGSFVSAGGVTVNNIARWDGSLWNALGGGITASFKAVVNTVLVLPNGDLVAGGAFYTAGGVPAKYIARWDGAAWHPMAAGLNSSVYALATLADGRLVAGGDFSGSSPDGAIYHYVAAWDGSAWRSLGANPIDQVRSLLVLSDGDLVAGLNNAAPVQRWNGVAWTDLGLGTSGGDSVHTVTALALLPDGDIVAGGDFDQIDSVVVNNIARWNGTAWAPFGLGLDGDTPGIGNIEVMPDGSMIVAGSFTSAGGHGSAYLARWSCAAACAADLNGDGVVDFGDYLEFLNLFDAQDPRVDFNHDGVVDFGDYLEFLNLFDAGC